jgi:putative transposase
MRYPASEKAEIIQLVEQSHLPAKRTLDKLGIPRATFYRWYDRYREGGVEALADHQSRPDRVWHRIPDDVRSQIIDLALELPELSPRELAVRFTDERKYFVSEASVYRLLKAHDLITSPAYVVIKAANEFKDKTTAVNQLWQTDFTYLKITGWGWYYLSTVLDDFSRYIVAWRLGPTMCASDVTATLDQALAASGLDHVTVARRPRLLSDNGSSYVADDLARWLKYKGMQHVRGAPYHPQTQGKIERWHQTLKNRILLDNYYLPGDLERQYGPSSNTTITSVTTRASTTSRQPMSTSAGPRQSLQNATASSATPSQTAACSINCRSLKLQPPMSQSLASQNA